MAKKDEAKSNQKTVSLNINETKDFMRHIIPNNKFIQDKGSIPVAIEVKGDSGIGKTSILLQVANEFDLAMVKLNLAQIEELGDLVGFPIRQLEIVKDEKLEWIDEHIVDFYSKKDEIEFTGRNRTSYCPPHWIADKLEKGGILMLDDWNRADTRFIQACMELIDRQTYVSWKLPKGWHIVLTSNPDDGEYNVQSIDNAQRTRFISVNLKFDIKCWGVWAEEQKIDSRCINFLLKHSELITKEVNARSAVMFFNSISSLPDFNDSKALSLITMVGEGSVGTEFTGMFTSFINNRLDKMLSPEEIIFNKSEDYVFKELKGIFNSKDGYRADLGSIIATRLINYCGVLAKETPKKVDKDALTRIKNLIKGGLFAKDLVYVLARGIYTPNVSVYKELTADKDVVKWILG